jgi:MoaA/NifB/PqqE/SkfB family radical SAM enzyme
MCPRSAIKDYGFMSLDTMETIVAQVDSSFVWELDLAGRGEPTIHPEFDSLLKILGQATVPTAVTTTGVTLNQKNLDALVAEVDFIRLSVSSINEATFNAVHIGLDYKKIWRNVSSLAEAAPDKVIVHLTGGPAIYKHLPQTVDYLKNIGLKKLNLFPLWNRGGDIIAKQENYARQQLISMHKLNTSEGEYSASSNKLEYFSHILRSWIINPNFCHVGDGSVSIGYRGEILGCFQDFGHKSLMGNIETINLKEWVRKRHYTLGNMKICEGCNAREAVFKWPALFGRNRS